MARLGGVGVLRHQFLCGAGASACAMQTKNIPTRVVRLYILFDGEQGIIVAVCVISND